MSSLSSIRRDSKIEIECLLNNETSEWYIQFQPINTLLLMVVGFNKSEPV